MKNTPNKKKEEEAAPANAVIPPVPAVAEVPLLNLPPETPPQAPLPPPVPSFQTVIAKGSTRNQIVSRRECGDVVQMIVREHGVKKDWHAEMLHKWNSLHGSHTEIIFYGLLTKLDPQREIVLV